LGHNPKEATWRYSHYYKGMANMLKLLEFVERLVSIVLLTKRKKLVELAKQKNN